MLARNHLHVVWVVDRYLGEQLQLIGTPGGIPGHVIRLQFHLTYTDASGDQQEDPNSCQHSKHHLHTTMQCDDTILR